MKLQPSLLLLSLSVAACGGADEAAESTSDALSRCAFPPPDQTIDVPTLPGSGDASVWSYQATFPGRPPDATCPLDGFAQVQADDLVFYSETLHRHLVHRTQLRVSAAESSAPTNRTACELTKVEAFFYAQGIHSGDWAKVGQGQALGQWDASAGRCRMPSVSAIPPPYYRAYRVFGRASRFALITTVDLPTTLRLNGVGAWPISADAP